jgi:hypothetical protein
MARQTVTKVALTYTGDADIVPNFEAAHADGHQFLNDGSDSGKNIILWIKNADAAQTIVTFDIPTLLENRYTVTDHTLTVAAGDEAAITGFTPTTYNQNGDTGSANDGEAGYVFFDFSNQTSITFCVVELPT